MKMTFKDFWDRFWEMADADPQHLDFMKIRRLWKTAYAHSKKQSYREKKIGRTVYCLTTACEGEKEIDHVIERLAVRNVDRHP